MFQWNIFVIYCARYPFPRLALMRWWYDMPLSGLKWFLWFSRREFNVWWWW